MTRYLSLFFILFYMLSAEAAPQCLALFERKSTQEMLEQLNDKYSHIFYDKALDENIQKSFYVAKKIKLFKMRRMFKSLEKRSASYDTHDIAQFVYKLDRLAFADTVLNDAEMAANLSKRDLQILSEARRSVLADGIIKYFEIDQSRSTLLKKISFYLSESISWKYWRWTQSVFYMPKLVGLSLPRELAEKILLTGLEANRVELERHIPAIKNRDYFNSFSKFYNSAVLISLLTVVPYLTHNYYVEQIRMGEENAAQILQPLVQTTQDMAKVNYLEQKEMGALEKYIEAYTAKYGSAPSEEHIKDVKLVLHEKIIAEAAEK